MRPPLPLLIVDDSGADAARIDAVLREAGLAPECRRVDSREALERALRALRPQAVLAERRLPDFDALAVLDTVRRIAPRMPVLFVSDLPIDAAAVRLVREGAADVMSKSQPAALAPALQRALAEADDSRARAQAERALKLTEMHLRRVFETSHDAVAILDSANGTIVEANRLMIDLVGCRREDMLGRKVGEIGPYKAVAVLGVVLRQLQQTDHVHYDHLALPRRDGETVEVEVLGNAYHLATVRFVQCTMRDITARRQAEAEAQRLRGEWQSEVGRRQKVQEALESSHQKLSEESLRDELTGLYNRNYLDQALLRAVSQAHRNRWLFSIMLIEVDQLKDCVARHGHAAGDLFMRTAGTHLRSAFRVADTVCRHGDETFAVLMPGTGPVAARDAAERLRSRVHVLDLVLDGVALPALTLSIGVAALTKPGQSADALLQAADRALQRGKQAGRDQARMYSEYVTLDTEPE